MAINEVIYYKNFKKIKAEMEKQPCIDDLLCRGNIDKYTKKNIMLKVLCLTLDRFRKLP